MAYTGKQPGPETQSEKDANFASIRGYSCGLNKPDPLVLETSVFEHKEVYWPMFLFGWTYGRTVRINRLLWNYPDYD